MPVDREQPIDRERVVRTALALLDENGLERLTLRRIAERLDVKAPALYWHFKNKKELLDAMGTAVLMDFLLDSGEQWQRQFTAPGDWAEFLHSYATGLRTALLKYRDGAKMAPGTYLTDNRMYAIQEAALRIMLTAGFTAEAANVAVQTVYNFTVGFAIEEQAMFPRPGESDANYAPTERLRRIDSELTPTVANLAAADHKRATDHYFSAGLSIILDGLRAQLARSGAQA